MKLAFAGFRHYHMITAYDSAAQNPEIEITGCFEENQEAREETIQKFPHMNFCYESYEQILNDPEIDAVCISDYFGKRGQMVIAALEHGKHVIADKPLCTDLGELERIEALVEEKNLQVFVLLDLRYNGTSRHAKKLVAEGAVGKIHNVTFTGQHCLNFAQRPSWYYEEGKHGGTINDIAIHGVDLVRYITGSDLTEVTAAKTWNAFCTQIPSFKDCGQFMARLGDIALMADVSYAAPAFAGVLPTYWDFTFWGQDGMLRFNLTEQKIHLYKKEETVIDCAPVEDDCMTEFLRAINGNPSADAQMQTPSVLNSTKQTLLIQKAAE